MRIIVCVKQVPDTTEVRIDPETNTLIREGVESILNPYDQFAVEEAVRIRDGVGEGRITVLSMGPDQARSALIKCLALGADDAVLLSDRAFAGADTWATSYTLAKAIKKLGDFNIIFCGQQAIDGDTAQVGPEVAQHLGISQVTYVEKAEVEGRKINIQKQTEEGYQILEAKMPVLLAGMPPTSFEPGYPPMSGILKAKKKPFEIWNAGDLGGDASRYGLDGSFTQVIKTYSPPPRGKGVIIEGDAPTAAKKLVEALVKDHVVSGGD
ncbi:MAG: electron transfer flavoprotein subunit beta [Candidatus Proteinoplasmatales archaeon SG8-5]|nr:MAG: electron transfer flavoprotein subunit beta [Candidatus Proteinoplasmatales archaeon SG8-5]